MRSTATIALALLASAGCQDAPAAAYDFAEHPLIGPGGASVTADPCPEGPEVDAACARLVSARRISWFGYLARWMQVLRTFGVPESAPGGYASYPANGLSLPVSHPDRALMPLVDQGSSRSQYVVLHDVLGEPADALGVEESTIVSFRAQHAQLITAAAVKQACRLSSSLAERVATHLASTNASAGTLAALDTLLVSDHGAGASAVQTIRGFKPEFGYLTFGRRLSASELAVLDASLGNGGSTRGSRFATFRVTLTGLMCSTMALVE